MKPEDDQDILVHRSDDTKNKWRVTAILAQMVPVNFLAFCALAMAQYKPLCHKMPIVED